MPAAWSLGLFWAQAPAQSCWSWGGQRWAVGGGCSSISLPSLVSTSKTRGWKEKDGEKQEQEVPGVSISAL